MRVVILVPRREDHGWRDRLWEFCRHWWEEHHDAMDIYEGHHDASEGPFNRSQAVNRAAALADAVAPWDVALIIDSDTISNPDAVREAIKIAHETGALAVAHTRRYMLNQNGTKRILRGYRGNWKSPQQVARLYHDSVSCAVAVSRATWDLVGGLDERFVGWGFEDTAFEIACQTMTGQPIVTVDGDCFHLWHPTSQEASNKSPTYLPNQDLKRWYQWARGDRDRLARVFDSQFTTVTEEDVSIPKILHRTVPEKTSAEVESWWRQFARLHPTWELRTYREPIDPKDWPMTGDLFSRCQNGAQKAGLIRLEAVFTHGGVYVDSDVEPYRAMDPLLQCRAFAAWEDEKVVPDAVMGAVAGHPAWLIMLERARQQILAEKGAWDSGPGGTTAVLPGRDDVILFPPGAFYPAHYLEKARLGKSKSKPWVFAEHKWHHSWGTPAQIAANASRQRAVDPAESITAERDVVICMPWRPNGDRHRLAARDWCHRWWAQAGYTIVEGNGQSRAEMCNDAAKRAIVDGATVLVFADADTWVPHDQLRRAVEVSRQTGRLTHAFTDYAKIGMTSTMKYLRMRSVVPAQVARNVQVLRDHVSGVTVVPVSLLQAIGGFDERFEGWGLEDRAFDMAASTIGEGTERIDGLAIHWYHKPDPTSSHRFTSDDPRTILIERYCRAAGSLPTAGRVRRLGDDGIIVVPEGAEPSAEVMREILSEPGGPLVPVSAG